MLSKRAYGGLLVECAVPSGWCGSVCYVLLPGRVGEDLQTWAESLSRSRSCAVVLLSGFRWDDDMTPWRAAPLKGDGPEFGGGAESFLASLAVECIPAVEGWLGLSSPERYLIGVSLSGLFSLWSLFRTDVFSGVASVSGSLWYDGFTAWAAENPIKSHARVYMSLGLKEKKASNARIASVEERTREFASLLKERGTDVLLEMVGGTHFSPLVPKFEKAAAFLLGNGRNL